MSYKVIYCCPINSALDVPKKNGFLFLVLIDNELTVQGLYVKRKITGACMYVGSYIYGEWRRSENFYSGKHYTNEKGNMYASKRKGIVGKKKDNREIGNDFTVGMMVTVMLRYWKILVKDVATWHDASYRAFEQIAYHTKDKDDSWVDWDHE